MKFKDVILKEIFEVPEYSSEQFQDEYENPQNLIIIEDVQE